MQLFKICFKKLKKKKKKLLKCFSFFSVSFLPHFGSNLLHLTHQTRNIATISSSIIITLKYRQISITTCVYVTYCLLRFATLRLFAKLRDRTEIFSYQCCTSSVRSGVAEVIHYSRPISVC